MCCVNPYYRSHDLTLQGKYHPLTGHNLYGETSTQTVLVSFSGGAWTAAASSAMQRYDAHVCRYK